MEQQNPNQTAFTTDSPDPHDRTSTPTEPNPKPAAISLSSPADPRLASAADTFLRFPRPQVNSDLADWISNSDPNIMRHGSSAEDSGLSDSTYELVHEDVDSESQDGYRTESMTGSICSLDDAATADDARSLAGTERTVDTESDTEGQGNSSLTAGGEQPPVPPTADKVEEYDDDLDAVHIHTPPPSKADRSGDDTASHESMEYTQQSLGTPTTQSIEQAEDEHGTALYDNKDADRLRWGSGGLSSLARNALSVVTCILILVCLPKPSFISSQPSLQGTSNLVTTTSTTSTEAVTTTTSIPSGLSTVIPRNGMALIPVEESSRTSFFGPKAPELVFTPRKSGQILVSIPDEARNTWSSKNCLFVGASRQDAKVDVQGSFSEEGALLRIPRKEAHGMIKLVIESKCGPKFLKVLDVYFSKVYIEEAYERTKHMVTEMRNVLPAAAQEAGRGYLFAKQYLGTAARYFDWTHFRQRVDAQMRNLTVATVPLAHRYHKWTAEAVKATRMALKDHKIQAKAMWSTARTAVKEPRTALRNGISTARRSLMDKISAIDPKGMSQVAHLTLVDAQVSAKLWWLKQTGKVDEYNMYQTKAKKHLSQLRGKVPTSMNKLSGILAIPNVDNMKQGFCNGLRKRGLKYPKQCKHAA